MRRTGFTIVELAYVMAVMGAVVAITVPTFDVLLRRARAGEATTFLAAIEHAELQHFRDTGVWLACPATAEGPKGAPQPFTAAGCWKALLGSEPLEP